MEQTEINETYRDTCFSCEKTNERKCRVHTQMHIWCAHYLVGIVIEQRRLDVIWLDTFQCLVLTKRCSADRK